MSRVVVVALAAAALAVPLVADAAVKSRIFLEDTIASGKSSSVTIQTQRRPAFRVLLRVPTQGRAKLFLLGKTAPRGGALIDTKLFACEGAAGSYYCRASYEALPKGRYTWRVSWVGVAKMPAHIELTVRW